MAEYNKMVVALIMSVLAIIKEWTGIDLGIDQATVMTIWGILTTFLVWLVPNKPAV